MLGTSEDNSRRADSYGRWQRTGECGGVRSVLGEETAVPGGLAVLRRAAAGGGVCRKDSQLRGDRVSADDSHAGISAVRVPSTARHIYTSILKTHDQPDLDSGKYADAVRGGDVPHPARRRLCVHRGLAVHQHSLAACGQLARRILR